MEIAATFDEISAVSALSEAERSPTQKTLGKDDFLALMITQLANQNPMEPMDNDEYITQMATFSQLELLQNMNSNLEKSLNWSLHLSQTINNTMATSLLGREVQASTDSVVIDETGTSKIRYDLESAAKNVIIEITSTDGAFVRVLREEGANSGKHEILWNGLDANGVQMPKGSYTINVTAKDSDDNDVAARAFFTGEVDSVRYINGQAYLSVDEVLIPLSEIMQVGVLEDEG